MKTIPYLEIDTLVCEKILDQILFHNFLNLPDGWAAEIWKLIFSVFCLQNIFSLDWAREGEWGQGRWCGAATRGKKRKHFSLSANTCQSALFQPWKMCVVTLIILKSMSYQRFTSQFKILHFNLVFKECQRITFEKYCTAVVWCGVVVCCISSTLISSPAPFTPGPLCAGGGVQPCSVVINSITGIHEMYHVVVMRKLLYRAFHSFRP